jgi:TIR domain
MAELTDFPDARWEDLLDLIETGKVVPIVGRRMSLVETGDGRSVPLQQAVSERLATELGVDPLPAGWGLNELYLSIANKNSFGADTFHPKLKRVLRSFQPQLEPLRKIAEIAHFRLFLSTAIDGFLEQAVREVCSARGETVAGFTFAPGYQAPHQPLLQPGVVCVYNLLGSRDTCPSWAVTDEALVEFVLALQSEKYRPEQLFDVLNDHHILAIGCQIPDWLGRFFLRSLRDGPLAEQREVNFLVEDARDNDVAFAHYLNSFGKKSYVSPGDAFAFVDELNRRWKLRFGDDAPKLPLPHVDADNAAAGEPAEAPGQVFISYSHEDRDAAQRLFDRLRASHVDVWKDDRNDALPKGANWDREIERRIADCACFVPLVSEHTGRTDESYFWKEWNLALGRFELMNRDVRRFIFPVLCDAGVKLPAQFGPMQATVLTDAGDVESLAASLRREQQRHRKGGR